MTKKINELFKVIIAMAMVTALCVGLAGVALADPGPITWEFGSENAPAEAAITKWLRMGESGKAPVARFDFHFAPVSVDGKTEEADKNTMPKIGGDTRIISIDFSNQDQTKLENGIEYIYKEKEVLGGIDWPHAGVYVYRVKELKNTYANDPAKDLMLYTDAEYDLYVYVKNGKDKLFVYAAGAVVRVKDVIHEDEDVGTKVDPTPGGNGKEYYTSQMIFTNDYLNWTAAFDLSKTVADEHGYANESMYFAFNVTVSNPTILKDAAKKYIAYVLDKSGTVVTDANNYAGFQIGLGGAYIEFTTGTPLTVNLKHGQRLSFSNMYVGGYFKVVESAYADFTPSAVLTVNGTANTLPGSLGASLTVPASGMAPFGAATNSAAFTNTYKLITPTGISVDNLPYVVMIAAGLGSLAGFVALKSRKRNRYYGE